MDSEIQAMSDIAKALSPLDSDAVKRVLKWALERYLPRQSGGSVSINESPGAAPERTAANASRTFLTLHELFDAADAEIGLDRVLVVAYWFQIIQGNADWDSQTVNTELKHLGHPSSNITRDLDSMMNRSPRLILQVRKQGTSKQARKLYALTREGIRTVDSMLAKTAPFSGS